MEKAFSVIKPVGLTPLECLNAVRKIMPEYADQKMAYAGRLDPMAEGVLLILVGEECKKRDDYQLLDKEYEFEVLYGFSTDTGDLMGISTPNPFSTQSTIDSSKAVDDSANQISTQLNNVTEKYNDFSGEISLKYPVYSSIRVEGKPLFYWANTNQLNQISIPEKAMKIEKMLYNMSYNISHNILLDKIKKIIPNVKGDFRQEEIVSTWEKLLLQPANFPVQKWQAKVGSGTYIRSISEHFGEICGIKATTLSINRTKVGEFTYENSVKIQ